MKKKCATGPIITKNTKNSESGIRGTPKGKGISKPVGTAITAKKGMHPTVTRHGFLANKETYR